jgi:NAD-dependent dihydropyrimidine dehydrogenase PreA subunit
MKVKRKIIQIDEELCDGCGNCVPSCAEGSLQIIDGKAKVIADNLCDGLGACLGECPQGALQIVEREADEFDEEAVEAHLAQQAQKEAAQAPAQIPCGCPSTQIKTFQPIGGCEQANAPRATGGSSALTHWPVQVHLVPPTAPFLKGADLLVAADCTPFAYPDFHQVLLKDRVLMIGCPKLDDAQAYIDKFTAIFSQAGVRSITTVMMEVPCCSGLSVIIRQALENAKANIPLEEVIISTRGSLLEDRKIS